MLASWSLHANRSSDVSYTVGGNPAVHANQEKYGTGLYLAGSPASDFAARLLDGELGYKRHQEFRPLPLTWRAQFIPYLGHRIVIVKRVP